MIRTKYVDSDRFRIHVVTECRQQLLVSIHFIQISIAVVYIVMGERISSPRNRYLESCNFGIRSDFIAPS